MKENISMNFSPNLFWDINLSELDMEKHQTFIVGRVLDYGSWEDWKLIRLKINSDATNRYTRRIYIGTSKAPSANTFAK